MATSQAVYDMVRDAMVAGKFIEDPTLTVPMRISPDGVVTIKGHFFEETKSYVPTGYADSPDNYALTVWWRAEDLTGFSEGDSLGTGSNSWFSHDNSYSASAIGGVYGLPNYTELKFADNKPSVHFNSATDEVLQMNSLFHLTGSTVSVLIKDDGTDGMILGNATLNKQIRRWRSGANNISAYWGTSDIQSLVFSSSAAQVVVLTWVFGSSTVTFYENKYDRFGGNLSTTAGTFDWIGRTQYGQALSGSIAEICIWSQQLSTSSLESLFDNYWKVKYSGETFYEA